MDCNRDCYLYHGMGHPTLIATQIAVGPLGKVSDKVSGTIMLRLGADKL